MATMISELYAALLDAGASPEKAQKAAEAMAGYESRFSKIEQELTVLKAMVAVAIAGIIAIVVKVYVP